MRISGVVFVLATLTTARCQSSPETCLVVVDEPARQVHRVSVERETKVTYDVPAVADARDVDYDSEKDMIYFLTGWTKIASVFVNGTNNRTIFDLGTAYGDAYCLAVDPVENKLFTGVQDPDKVLSMTKDATDIQVLAELHGTIGMMGVDSHSRRLYWSVMIITSKIYSIGYDGTDYRETMDIYQSRNPRSIDFEAGFLYSGADRGLCRQNIVTGNYNYIFRDRDFWKDGNNFILDVNTQRLFHTNDGDYRGGGAPYIRVFSTNGTELATLEWLPLTVGGKKFVRVIPCWQS